MMQGLADEVTELEKEHGIDEMKMDAAELKKAATGFMASKGISAITLGPTGKVAKLIEASSGMWVTTKADLKGMNVPPGTKTLKQILPKEIFKRVTRRRADAEAIAEAVDEGLIDEEEIKQAYVEIPKAAYVRLFDDGG
jgi:hypothetical protein